MAPPGTTPAQDPKFAALKWDIAGTAKTAKAHPPAAAEVKKVQDAAVAPPDDKEAQAKAAQAEKMDGAKPGGFDKAKFIAAVTAAIEAQRPTTNDEAKEFSNSGKAGAIKSQVAGMVSQGKQDSAKDIAEKTGQAPDPSAAKDKPVTPLPPAGPAPQLPPPDAKKAIPDKAPAEQMELGATKCELNSKMADSGVTEDQLAKSNEPEFTAALDAKKGAEQHAATAPPAARAEEATQLNAATAQADATGKAGVQGMVGARTTATGQAETAKSGAKAKDEAERGRITTEIKKIFDGTKGEVDKILGDLDGKVTEKFEAGERAARAAFEADHKKRMADYEDEIGLAQWLIDKFRPTQPRVMQIFVEAAATYEKQLKVVISDVADLIGSELDRAKSRIAKGRADVAAFVAEQPTALRGVAKQAAQQIGTQFDGLDSSVDAKQDALVDDLAAKYTAAREDVDKRVKELQDENKSWRDKAVDAVGGAIETILKLKDMLLGVLSRAAGAVENIIKDPIAFLGKFVNAVKTGVMSFGSNILQHLKKGLQGWLFGALAEAGIEIPDKFDLKGIVQLILSLLGLTWNAIRARITKIIPEPVMKVIETSVDFVKAILSEGVVGLWKWIVAKLSDLKEMVMGQIKEFVVTKIITAGITWLISLLNPAAAFIKACKMIYDAVMWFVDNAARLKDFVDSVLDSVASIASGGVGAVAGYIEQTLAKTLPMVISGLASLLGLGGISDKIKKVLETIQKPVMSVVDKLVGTAVKFGKKLLGKLKGKVQGGDDSPEGKKMRLDKGLAAARGAVNRLPGSRLVAAAARPVLSAIKLRYGMTALELFPKGRRWAVRGTVNPSGETDTDREMSDEVAESATTGLLKDHPKLGELKARLQANHADLIPAEGMGADADTGFVRVAGPSGSFYKAMVRYKPSTATLAHFWHETNHIDDFRAGRVPPIHEIKGIDAATYAELSSLPYDTLVKKAIELRGKRSSLDKGKFEGVRHIAEINNHIRDLEAFYLVSGDPREKMSEKMSENYSSKRYDVIEVMPGKLAGLISMGRLEERGAEALTPEERQQLKEHLAAYTRSSFPELPEKFSRISRGENFWRMTGLA